MVVCAYVKNSRNAKIIVANKHRISYNKTQQVVNNLFRGVRLRDFPIKETEK